MRFSIFLYTFDNKIAMTLILEDKAYSFIVLTVTLMGSSDAFRPPAADNRLFSAKTETRVWTKSYPPAALLHKPKIFTY